MRKSWPYLAFSLALTATSVWNAPLVFQIPFWIIGAVMFVRRLVRDKGFERWWPVACVGVFAAAIATVELATGLSRGLRLAIVLLGGAALVAMIVPPLVALVKVLLEARTLIKQVRASLKDRATLERQS